MTYLSISRLIPAAILDKPRTTEQTTIDKILSIGKGKAPLGCGQKYGASICVEHVGNPPTHISQTASTFFFSADTYKNAKEAQKKFSNFCICVPESVDASTYGAVNGLPIKEIRVAENQKTSPENNPFYKE